MDEETRRGFSRWGRDLVISVVVVPAILAGLQMSPWAMAIGGVISLLLLKLWERRPSAGIVSALVIVSLFVAFKAREAWRDNEWPFHRSALARQVAIRQLAAPETTILFDCHTGLAPNVVPASGRYNVLPLDSLNQKSLGHVLPLSEYFTTGQSGAPWKLTSDPLQMAETCSVTNYGGVPLFGVEVTVRLIFKQAVSRTDGSQAKDSGPVILDGQYNVRIPKLDVGINNPFVFYVWEMVDSEFAYVGLPKTITAKRLGESQSRTIKLIDTSTTDFWLSPPQPVKAPTAAPQPRQPSHHIRRIHIEHAPEASHSTPTQNCVINGGINNGSQTQNCTPSH
jgi:hypothetical protein